MELGTGRRASPKIAQQHSYLPLLLQQSSPPLGKIFASRNGSSHARPQFQLLVIDIGQGRWLRHKSPFAFKRTQVLGNAARLCLGLTDLCGQLESSMEGVDRK